MAYMALSRRRRRKNPPKDHNHASQQSDPEQRIDVNGDNDSDESKSGWGSLDEALLQIVGGNSSAVEEAEVSRRLSSLNVSEGQSRLSDHMYSKPPSGNMPDSFPGDATSDRLGKRHCRKRSCKRNRKRTKKIRSADCPAIPGFLGKQKRISHWLDGSRVCSHTPASPLSSENQTTGQNHKGDSSETSSRAVTDESDSPDDADMCQLIDDTGAVVLTSMNTLGLMNTWMCYQNADGLKVHCRTRTLHSKLKLIDVHPSISQIMIFSVSFSGYNFALDLRTCTIIWEIFVLNFFVLNFLCVKFSCSNIFVDLGNPQKLNA